MSYSDEKTEKQLKKLERELASLYKEAYKDMSKEADKYFAQYEERWKREYQAFLDGKYTETEFKNWEATQLARGKQWEKVRDMMAKRIGTANQTASAYINDTTPSIYSLNANYEAYQIAKDTGNLQSSWDMVDEQIIRELVQNGGHTEFKTTKVNPKRDYEWNSQQIQRALNAGILQGKSIDKIADSFMIVMKRNRTSAIRNARTAVTSAQNAGRLKGLEQAKKMDIDVQKKWTSSGDDNVRFTHAMLNGQIRDTDKPFSNGLMHPADSNGAPAEVYNCRCRLTYVYPKYENVQSNEVWEEMTPAEKLIEKKRYKEWAKSQAGTTKKDFKPFTFSKGTSVKKHSSGFTKFEYNIQKNTDFDTYAIEKITLIANKIEERYGSLNIDKIAPMDYRIKGLENAIKEGTTACYITNSKGSEIQINQGIVGNIETRKAFEAKIKEEMKWINANKEDIISLPDGEAKRYFEAVLKTQRTNVSHSYDWIEGCVVHESAHALQDVKIDALIKAKHIDIEQSMKQYASNISGYALNSVDDYIAESFTSNWYGENIIDPELKAIFEELENEK